MTVPPITTASFNGDVFPPDVVSQIFHLGLSKAPIFDSLTRRTTSRSSLVFATANPSGFGWTEELGLIPTVDPADDSAVVSVLKLAGQILLSNESVGDSELNLTTEVARLIGESMSARADIDLCYGVTPPASEAPVGFFDALTTVDSTTLRGAVVDAASAILTAGGNPDTVLMSPALWAAETIRRESQPTATAALFADLGIPLKVKVAATLAATDALVFDSTGAFGVIRNDFSIEASDSAGDAWSRDGVSLRVKARLAVAVPSPAKSMRALTVTPEEPVTP